MSNRRETTPHNNRVAIQCPYTDKTLGYVEERGIQLWCRESCRDEHLTTWKELEAMRQQVQRQNISYKTS